MDRMIYTMNNISKTELINNGFKYSRYLSDIGDDVYTYKFPLVSYNKIITIECEIAVSILSGIANVNVYNTSTKELYAPYYDREFGNYEIIKSIDDKIKKKLSELGIKEL